MRGRLGHSFFDELRRIRCRRSIVGLRSIHLTPNYSSTQTQPREHPVSPAIDGSRWVMLSTNLCRRDTVADARTVAESCTSSGRGFRVSAVLASPPASSFLCYDLECSASGDDDGEDAHEYADSLVTAHGDSVLLRFGHSDYFVYSGGTGTAGRLPSLSLLPSKDFSDGFEGIINHELLDVTTTGLLRRGEDELLVVELGVRNQSGAPPGTIDLNVLRVGSWEWELRWAVPIVHSDGSRRYELNRWRQTDKVIPVGDRFLCWVKYSSGFLLCDMADPNLMFRSLPLPVEGRRGNRRYNHYEDEDDHMQYCRNMCGVGGNALRFVSIDPRCCCGGPGRATCPHSSFAFTVTTWTMSLRMGDEMAWVMDGVLDCEELWDLPGYEGLPYVPPSCPVMSLSDPDVICFKVSDHCLRSCSLQQEQVWMLEVDTRRKVLLSVAKCSKDPYDHLPAKFNF